MQKAAIVILNFNGKKMLEKFLPVALEHSYYQIYVADNASTDGSINFLKKQFPDLPLILLDQNFGFSKGYNEALKRLKGQFEYYILLNSDVEVPTGWDKKLLEWMDQHPEAAASQPKVISYPNDPYFDHAGAAGGFWDALGYPYCRGRILTTYEKDQGQYDDVIPINWATGACFVVRAKAWHEENGFDDGFFAHMEEIDLCWRFAKRGYKVYCNGLVSIKHVGGATLAASNPYKTYLNFRNSLWMLYKNLEPRAWIDIYRTRKRYDALAYFHFLMQGKWKHAQAIVKAYADFRKEQEQIQKHRPLASKLPIAPYGKPVNSIILAYYLKGKKVFSQL
ncbi:glycosyltransferase family 2 protein [Pararhodonellum marinum]|uniref:glycosyltransferase family 2 protein n=1 Tax=Pararhodonellum marinum TaxID=2755358 RepID=UPI00189072C4|nr:glycosyltransferase family 2 protein [Pararhodonellum marinum]